MMEFWKANTGEKILWRGGVWWFVFFKKKFCYLITSIVGSRIKKGIQDYLQVVSASEKENPTNLSQLKVGLGLAMYGRYNNVIIRYV